MRGEERESEGLFSYIRLEERIAKDHPLRAIRALVNEALAALSSRFDELYSQTGRPSIAPEYLLRATLLQAFFTVRSERQLMEQIDYNLLFRWFVGLSIDDAVWDASSFSKNRDRLLEADVAREFLATLLSLPKVKRLLSSDHFSVDGTLLEAWASMKSFRPKDGSGDPPAGGRNGERNFHREKRSNETHTQHDRPRCQALSQGRRPGEPTVLHGPCADGEPQRAGGRWRCHAGDRHGGTRHRSRPDRQPSPGQAADHRGRRQGLRCRGLRAGLARAQDHPAHRHRRSSVQDRQAAQDRHRSNAPCVIPATPSANVAANASRKCSAGSRRRAAWLRSKFAAWPRCRPSSPSPSSPIISCEYPSFWRRHEPPRRRAH